MERYSTFLGRKNQYCEMTILPNSLQIQCDPYEIISGIFHRTRTKKFTIHLETQKTPNSHPRPTLCLLSVFHCKMAAPLAGWGGDGGSGGEGRCLRPQGCWPRCLLRTRGLQVPRREGLGFYNPNKVET